MTITSQNRKLAVTPIKDVGLKLQKVNGIVSSLQSNSTVVTTLLADALVGTGSAMEIVPKGTKVAFLGRAEKAPWNKEIFKHDDFEFVLAPMEEVIFLISED